MEMGSRGGGWDVFGGGHLVERISPGFLVKVNTGKVLLLGRRDSFDDLLLLPVPEPVVDKGTIVAVGLYWQAQSPISRASTALDALR